MTRQELKIKELIANHLGIKPDNKTLCRLLEAGLIDIVRSERVAYKIYIDRLVKSGISCCEAMFMAAEEFNCSYEKIRKNYYLKP